MVEKSNFIVGTLILLGAFSHANVTHAYDTDGASMLFTSKSYTSFPAVEVRPNFPAPPTPFSKPDLNHSKSQVDSNKNPVQLLADRVEYDQNQEIVRAIGNIELAQNGRVLNASQILYDLKKDIVVASGDVRLMEATGEEYFADNFELKDQMRNGFVRSLRGMLPNGGRFTAETGEKIDDFRVIMQKATYTACEPCQTDPNKSPVWQLKARDIVHDKKTKRVSYKDATFEVKGVPVAYIPYFSHPDGTVKRKSGFLVPSLGFDSQLGASYSQEYYWDIAPDKDATIGLSAFTQEAPLLSGEYRQRFENAEIQLNGGITYSSRTDRDGETEDDEARGHIFGDARWNLNEKWRAGLEIAAVTDEQYLRQYNISNEDVLENRLYAERFSDRNYALAQAIRFKDVRVSDSASIDQPNILPELYTRIIGAPNATLGGRWHLEASGLDLRRDGNEQDVLRGSIKTGWNRLFVNDLGVVTTVEANLRGDAYRTNDLTVSNGQSERGSALRGFANVDVQAGLPLQKRLPSSQVVIEPLGAITVGTNLNDDNDIPNEDSQDVFLDATNLFNANRFPGYDRIEDDIHATYGVRVGLHSDNGNNGSIFLGQSYRFDEDDNPFPSGSGLEEQESDFVGAIDANIGDLFNLNYRLQLRNDSFASQRHELDTRLRMGPVQLRGRYFYADGLDGTNLSTRREQVRSTIRYQFNDKLALFGGAQYDLASETEGLRQAVYGLNYEEQCVSYGISATRNLTSESSGDSGTQIMLRIGLKTLGEFETSAFTIGGGDGTSDDEDEEDNLENAVLNQ